MTNMSDSRELYGRRVMRLVVLAIVVELALWVVTRLGPALAPLMTSVYVIVAALFALAIWHARHRSGADRRHDERRHSNDS